MQEIGGFLLIAYLGLVMLLSVAFIVIIPFTLLFTKTGKQIREDEQKRSEEQKAYEAAVAATARTKLVDGEWKTVTTRTFRIIINKKNGRKAAIVHVSRLGRHYYVQPLLKDLSIGKSKPHWTRLENWQSAGEVELPFVEGPADEPSNLDSIHQ